LLDLPAVATVAGHAATIIVNVALLVMTFSVLPAHRRPLRELLPGAVVGGILLTALLQLGTWVVSRYIAGASDTYGTFAVVIALLSWFHLVSRVVLLAAELNDVLLDRLWPRSMVAGSALTDADRRAAVRDMQRVQRDERFGFALAVGDELDELEGDAGHTDVSRHDQLPPASERPAQSETSR
jgi:membrane protein